VSSYLLEEKDRKKIQEKRGPAIFFLAYRKKGPPLTAHAEKSSEGEMKVKGKKEIHGTPEGGTYLPEEVEKRKPKGKKKSTVGKKADPSFFLGKCRCLPHTLKIDPLRGGLDF